MKLTHYPALTTQHTWVSVWRRFQLTPIAHPEPYAPVLRWRRGGLHDDRMARKGCHH